MMWTFSGYGHRQNYKCFYFNSLFFLGIFLNRLVTFSLQAEKEVDQGRGIH